MSNFTHTSYYWRRRRRLLAEQELPTEEPSEPLSEAPTEEPSEPLSEAPTEEPSEPISEALTEEPSEPISEPPTEIPELSISGSPTTTATRNSAYAGFTPSTTGGVPPYAYSLAAGSLPTGMSLNTSTGAITGTPTVFGSFNGITLRVTDDANNTDDLAPFNLTVASDEPVITDTGLNAESITSSINTPSGILGGDIIAIAEYASNAGGTPHSDTVPTGFTKAVTIAGAISASNATRMTISFKRAAGTFGAPSSDANLNLSGEMNDNSNRKAIRVFRSDRNYSSLVIGDTDGVNLGTNPGAITLTNPGGGFAAPHLTLAVWGVTGGSPGLVSPRTMSPAKNGEMEVGGLGSDLFFGWRISNQAFEQVSVDMDDEGSNNLIAAAQLRVVE